MTEPTRSRWGFTNEWLPAAIAGLIAALLTWWVWGSVNPIPVVSDEQSYVLQSRIFAGFHWKAPSPPIPEFFEQSHVLVTPAVASKFPPGHALLLSIGTLFGAPFLISLLLTGLTGALLFRLTERIASPYVAVAALLIWLADPINLRFRPSYFSEITTAFLWLLAWWALLEWRAKGDRRWLFILAAAIGWGAITRPLTMLAFAAPVGVLVLVLTARRKRWVDFGLAVGIGIAILGVLPVWSKATTGEWTLSPLTLYQRDYLPFDKPGFGVDSTPPAKPLNPVNQATYAEFYREHVAHRPSNLPVILGDRLRMIGISEWRGPRVVLAPLALIGAIIGGAELWFALACALALFAGYATYGHFAEWTLYYFEGIPALSVAAAVGLWWAIDAMRHHLRASPLIPGSLLLLGWSVAHEANVARGKHRADALYYTEFNQAVDALPKNPTVIFVRYAPRLQAHPNIVTNSPQLEAERVWVVNDLGARDADLMKVAGARVPIYFYEEGQKFELARDLIGH